MQHKSESHLEAIILFATKITTAAMLKIIFEKQVSGVFQKSLPDSDHLSDMQHVAVLGMQVIAKGTESNALWRKGLLYTLFYTRKESDGNRIIFISRLLVDSSVFVERYFKRTRNRENTNNLL